MKVRLFFLALIVVLCAGLCACSSRSGETIKNDADQKAVSLVALLPVDNQTGDARASKMLRLKSSDELRFKGYPQVDIDLIDSRLAALADAKKAGNNDAVAPGVLREMLGADAAMYCCLMESKAAKKIFYTPVTVSVRCELRSTATGETLWNAQGKSTGRSFDLRSKTLDMKTAGDLEAVLEEVVGQIMETLPYGPKLRG
jgi:hypothetical protein